MRGRFSTCKSTSITTTGRSKTCPTSAMTINRVATTPQSLNPASRTRRQHIPIAFGQLAHANPQAAQGLTAILELRCCCLRRRESRLRRPACAELGRKVVHRSRKAPQLVSQPGPFGRPLATGPPLALKHHEEPRLVFASRPTLRGLPRIRAYPLGQDRLAAAALQGFRFGAYPSFSSELAASRRYCLKSPMR